jgi:Tfp pilus assembly protein PilF
MRHPDERLIRSNAWRRAFLLAAAWIASGCTAPGAAPRPPVEVRDPRGFTISESGRISGRARTDFDTAIRLLEQGDTATGIPLLVTVTEAAPKLTTAHIDLAIAYARVGELEKAKASLERALELNPRHPVAHNELGILYRRTGRFAEARQSYEKALAAYPDFHFARRNLAILCDLYLSDLDCALEHYGLYLQAVPDDPEAAMWLSDLRARAGR